MLDGFGGDEPAITAITAITASIIMYWYAGNLTSLPSSKGMLLHHLLLLLILLLSMDSARVGMQAI